MLLLIAIAFWLDGAYRKHGPSVRARGRDTAPIPVDLNIRLAILMGRTFRDRGGARLRRRQAGRDMRPSGLGRQDLRLRGRCHGQGGTFAFAHCDRMKRAGGGAIAATQAPIHMSLHVTADSRRAGVSDDGQRARTIRSPISTRTGMTTGTTTTSMKSLLQAPTVTRIHTRRSSMRIRTCRTHTTSTVSEGNDDLSSYGQKQAVNGLAHNAT